MKFSYNWIREMVPGLDVPAKELGLLITMKTAECEGVEPYGAHMAAVVAAKLLSVEPIEGSHNTKVVVDTARHGTKTVVCGAPNARAGLVSAYVPAGTLLEGREIRKATISGIESDGMLSSGAELGINRDSAGILSLDAAPGETIAGCEPDWIIEIDNKSMTHRPDLWGHFGMAREVAAILGLPLKDPVRLDLAPNSASPIRVAIEDLDLCPRYSALVMDQITIQPSPLWMQYRLMAIGLNPISNVVDATNWVMAELAQPMHAFDLEALAGDTIYIRPARAGEKLVTLDEVCRELQSANVVIADANGPIALAGVMGGWDSAINDRTRRVVLESANFHAANIRRTASQQKMRTDASMRFEKSQDPVNTVRGLARMVELLYQVSAGASVVGGLADAARPMTAPPAITLPMEWLVRKLGREVAPAEVRQILERLEFGVSEPTPGVFSVTVPSWRATKDVSIKDDLVEEVGRMIGYGSIPVAPPAVPSTPPPVEAGRMYHRAVRAAVAAQGFTEVYNYSFVNPGQLARFGMDPAAHIRVANPISVEQGLLRTSLLPNIVRNIEDNARHFDTFRLFEIGSEIHARPSGLPHEVPHLMAAQYSRESTEAALLELKRLAECVLPEAGVRPGEARVYEHPARAAEVVWRGQVVGRLYELHPSVLEGRAAILDIDLDATLALAKPEKRYQPIRRFPSSAFDLSVIAQVRDLAGEIERKLVSFAGDELDRIEFLRQYSGAPLMEGAKSVSYRLTISSGERTLTAEDLTRVRTRIIDGMRGLGYLLRV
jgi:phenylalanyl-tRNA synthetase beta chain